MRGAVFAGLDARVRTHQDEGPVRFLEDRLAGLIADGVQAGGDMPETGKEGAVGRPDPQMTPVC